MRRSALKLSLVLALLAGCADMPKFSPTVGQVSQPAQQAVPSTDTAQMETANPADNAMVGSTAAVAKNMAMPATPVSESMLFTPSVDSGVIVYEKPQNKSAVVGLVEVNANVAATGEEQNGYMRVEGGGISGWVDKQLLKKSGSQNQAILMEAPRKAAQKNPRPRVVVMKPAPARQIGPAGDGTAEGRVVLYSASWCPYCDKARAFMQNQGVAFEEYDTETHPKGRRDYAAMNGNGIPIVLVGNHKIVGWKQAEFERHYAKSQSQPEPQQEARPEPAPPVQVVAVAVVAKPIQQSVVAEAGPAYVPKVASGVVVYSQPTNTSKVGGLLKGADQVIAQGEEQNGYMRVQGATGEGWVDKTLMRKL
jgi:glutaredoxin